ncbi:hypothetical protein NIES593_09800 [Hydrococcus rivularis NIES-593]|uniref:Lipopolysaccharide biosynthesis protein n=1 Tax=Hydrococcus rivularis NIES-593 TaxID=1921803 RepID=A0A1U7HIU5_9CYAN|nr:hypothetical protein [Hydrococcus rivularis]OKH23513.1 hypothetical protein NIES593_09800 [Hydrococcus rivularis NIES-593]
MAITPKSLTDEKSKPIGRSLWWRFLKYAIVGIFANAGLWAIAIIYLKNTPPTYTSEATLNVAGNGPGVSVNLPEIGQAYTSSASAFGSSSSDPRENYKIIASSATVIKAAAQSLKIPQEAFGEPRIKLINNTTLLSIAINGKDPEKTQQKLQALYRALNEKLNYLRQTERTERDRSNQKALSDAQKKLTEAQRRLSEYKAESGLNSSSQIKELISNIELLRKQRSEIYAQQQQLGSRLKQLSVNLQLSPQEAADALVLQTDQQFQKSFSEYTTATTTLKALLSDRGPNYPDVVAARQQQEAALAMLLERGKALLGKPVEQLTLERLNLDNSNGSGGQRAQLFQQLVTLESDYQGLTAQVRTLTQQVQKLETRLQGLSQKEAVLDALLRQLQIAEAVFASTLAKVDLGRGDPFGSFPLIQMVEEPSLPEEPTAPKPKLVLAGAVLGSLLVTTSLTLIWWRDPLATATKKILKEIVA